MRWVYGIEKGEDIDSTSIPMAKMVLMKVMVILRSMSPPSKNVQMLETPPPGLMAAANIPKSNAVGLSMMRVRT